MTNPLLSGIRVLDLSRLLPGPFCTLYLAQLGAEVIKIEEPNGGDYARSMSPPMFELVNRGKQSVTLDLRQAEGLAAFKHLVKEADVVIESFRPGVMDKLGAGFETLKAINPRLVYAALTGYGQTGPYRDRAGHDINYLGYTGALDQTGAAGGPPTQSNIQIADLAGGALTCAIGILAAVIGARASGVGAYVDVAMLDGTLALQVLALSVVNTLGHGLPRGEDMLTGALPNYGVYEAADGYIAMGALEAKFFANFCKAAGRADLLKLPMVPGKAGAPLREELKTLIRSRSRDEWETLLADADCCVSAVYTPDEALKNEQAVSRGLIGTSAGKPAIRAPFHIDGAPLPDRNPAPALGRDTAAVLGKLGYGEADLQRLKAAKAI